jgi:hypothetical protein
MTNRLSTELMLRIHNRDTEIQRAFDFATGRRDALQIEINRLQQEKQAMEETIEKCYTRAAQQGISWAL